MDQRFIHLSEVGDLRRPVIHLCVDIYRVFTSPVRQKVLVPPPLKVSRFTASPAAGNQHVPPELEYF